MTHTTSATIDDLALVPEKAELIDGVIVTMSPASAITLAAHNRGMPLAIMPVSSSTCRIENRLAPMQHFIPANQQVCAF